MVNHPRKVSRKRPLVNFTMVGVLEIFVLHSLPQSEPRTTATLTPWRARSCAVALGHGSALAHGLATHTPTPTPTPTHTHTCIHTHTHTTQAADKTCLVAALDCAHTHNKVPQARYKHKIRSQRNTTHEATCKASNSTNKAGAHNIQLMVTCCAPEQALVRSCHISSK